MVPATPLRHLLTLSVLGVGAALLWATRPRFDVSAAPGEAKSASCLSNLSQISRAYALYAGDFGGKIPLAIDPSDRFNKRSWQPKYPGDTDYTFFVQTAPFLHVVLRPYLDSPTTFRCPSDRGWKMSRMDTSMSGLSGLPNVLPSSFIKYGTSYYLWTIYGFQLKTVADIENPGRKVVIFDGDLWHGSGAGERMGALFIDGHAEMISQAQHGAFAPPREF